VKAYFVASDKEGKAIFPHVNFRPWKFNILKGEYNGIPVFVIGVSKTSAAFSASMIFNELDISEAVLTGVCGAYRSSDLNVGDVIGISEDYFADEGLFLGGEVELLHEMGFGFADRGCSVFDTSDKYQIVKSNTVSYLDGDGEVADIYMKKTGAAVENMEGAAFGYVCNQLGIRVLQIRAVSNYCGKRDNQEWDIKKALQNLKRLFEYDSI
jgi:futalosine hydrolase